MKTTANRSINFIHNVANKSGISLSAHKEQMLQHSIYPDAGVSVLVSDILRDRCLSTSVKLVIELQFMYGLRITSLLNLTTSDITQSGALRIKQGKGSEDLIVYSQRYSEYLQKIRNVSGSKICDYSRFYFYRLYMKKGLYEEYGKNMKRSVTHMFRHNIALSMKNSNISVEEVKRFLGHKSIKSTRNYYDKKAK